MSVINDMNNRPFAPWLRRTFILSEYFPLCANKGLCYLKLRGKYQMTSSSGGGSSSSSSSSSSSNISSSSNSSKIN